MTTIAYRDGVIAADSQETREGEHSGDIKLSCEKLFRIQTALFSSLPEEVIVATAGESSPGRVFMDWLETNGGPYPEWLRDKDIAILILTSKGLYEFDGFGFGVRRREPFYAIGTGSMCALSAMEAGASAEEAVRIAAKYDPYTGGNVVVERL